MPNFYTVQFEYLMWLSTVSLPGHFEFYYSQGNMYLTASICICSPGIVSNWVWKTGDQNFPLYEHETDYLSKFIPVRNPTHLFI